MSRENLNLVRRHDEAFNRREISAILADPPRIVFEETESLPRPDRRTVVGHAAVEEYFSDFWTDAVAGLQIEPFEMTQHDEEILVGIRLYIRGKTGRRA